MQNPMILLKHRLNLVILLLHTVLSQNLTWSSPSLCHLSDFIFYFSPSVSPLQPGWALLVPLNFPCSLLPLPREIFFQMSSWLSFLPPSGVYSKNISVNSSLSTVFKITTHPMPIHYASSLLHLTPLFLLPSDIQYVLKFILFIISLPPSEWKFCKGRDFCFLQCHIPRAKICVWPVGTQ